MIPHGVEVFVCIDAIDLRWGFDRLAGVVAERVGRDCRGGALFVFFGKRRSAIKILFADSTGLCVFYKRLDKGTFCVPTPARDDDSSVIVDERTLDDLLDGVSIETPQPRQRRERVRLQ